MFATRRTLLSKPAAAVVASGMVITTNQATLKRVTFTIKGTVGQSLTFSWGDTTSTVISPTGSDESFYHDYALVGSYTITISGAITTLLSLTLNNTTLTTTMEEIEKLSGLTYLSIINFVKISGNFSTNKFPVGLTYMYVHQGGGGGPLSGALIDLPRGLTYFRHGGPFALTGTWDQLPPNIQTFFHTGVSTITGTMLNLPRSLTYFYVGNFSSLSGTTADFPPNMGTWVSPSVALTGDIASLPASLTYLGVSGLGPVTGNYANLPPNITTFAVGGSTSHADDYTAGRTWKSPMNYFQISQAAGYGLTTDEVDAILIDLANVAAWTGDKAINLRSVNAARSSASDAAVAALVAKGVTVLTN